MVREWLPHAEAELKFKALPEDEDQIVHLIENHEVKKKPFPTCIGTLYLCSYDYILSIVMERIAAIY